MARPNILGESELLAVPVPLDLKARFETIAELQGVSASALARQVIGDNLDEYPAAHDTTWEEINAGFSSLVEQRIGEAESGAYITASGRRRLEKWSERFDISFSTSSETSSDPTTDGVLDRLRAADSLKRPSGKIPIAGLSAYHRLTSEFDDMLEKAPAIRGILSMFGVEVENMDQQLETWKLTYGKVINSFVRAAVQVRFEGQLPSASEIMADIIDHEKIWQEYVGITDPVKPTLLHKLVMRFSPSELQKFVDDYGYTKLFSPRNLQHSVALVEPRTYLDAQLENRPLIS